MKTTETPWRVADHYIMAPDKSVLAIIPGDSIEEKANAALIVRAVNSHAQLIKALESAHRYLSDSESEMQSEGNWTDAEQDLLEQLSAALSLAKGEA